MIELKGRQFEIIKDYRDAFDLEEFEKRYVPEVYDKYTYITGDISAGMLRLKGFAESSKKNHYKMIPDFLAESCAYGCPFYILKRIGGQKNDRNRKTSSRTDSQG